MEGQQARAAVDHARESVATLIGARSSEIVFTSGGTESDNLALFGSLKAGDHLVTSAIEHSAVLHAAQELAKRGVEVTYVGCDAASRVSPEAVQAAMRPNTKLVSIMLANNETGVLQPAPEFAAIAHAHGALFHTDAVQAAGKIPISVAALECDLLSVSAHKIHGPQGVGALYVRRNVRVAPLFYGGTHERQRRAGTENVPGIVGFGKAAELAQAVDGGWRWRSWHSCSRTRPPGIWNPFAAIPETGVNGAGARSASVNHHQPLLRSRGGRGAAHRAGSEGTGRLRRLRLPVRRNRAIARSARDGALSGTRTRQPALLALQADDKG